MADEGFEAELNLGVSAGDLDAIADGVSRALADGALKGSAASADRVRKALVDSLSSLKLPADFLSAKGSLKDFKADIEAIARTTKGIGGTKGNSILDPDVLASAIRQTERLFNLQRQLAEVDPGDSARLKVLNAEITAAQRNVYGIVSAFQQVAISVREATVTQRTQEIALENAAAAARRLAEIQERSRLKQSDVAFKGQTDSETARRKSDLALALADAKAENSKLADLRRERIAADARAQSAALAQTVAQAKTTAAAQARAQVEAAKQVTDAQRAAAAVQLAETRKNAALQVDEARKAASLEVNAAREASKLKILEAQTNGRIRATIVRATLDGLLKAERAYFSALGAIGKAGLSGIGKVYDSTFGAIGKRIAGHQNDVLRSERSFSSSYNSSVSSRMRRSERTVVESLSRQERLVREAQSRVNQGLIGVSRNSQLLGGLAAGGGLTALLTSGFDRASTLETLNKQFVALLGNAEQAAKLSQQVKDFSRITPFDLTGVATLAKGFLTIGTAADKIIPSIAKITDAVSLTGGGTAELERIQRAIGQVVSAGRLQGDELNQLAENLPGLNIRQILADQLTGGNVAELVKLQEAGKITGEQFVTGLMNGLESDPRLAFATLAAADSLRGRLDNLKESFADVGASFIQQISGPLKASMGQLQVVLQTVADFIKGEGLSEGLLVFRDALKGAAIGVGALLAAKGGVEVIGLIGKLAAAAASPLGLISVAVIGVSAAFTALRGRSKEFDEAVNGAVERVLGLVGPAREVISSVADGAAALLGRISGPVLGFLERVGEGAASGLGKAVEFVRERVFPVLENVASFLGDLIPRAAAIAKTAVSGVFSGVSSAVGFIAGAFTSVRESVRGLLASGGGSGDGSGGGFLSGLKATAQVIFDEVRERIDSAILFIQTSFRKIDWKELASGALGFVEQVGFIVGNISTDPRLVKALLAIAAVAAVVALKFAQGLAEGILDNVPELAKIAGKIVVALVDAIASNLLLSIPIIAAAIAKLFFSDQIKSKVTDAGKGLASSLGQGLLAGLKNVASPRQFIANLQLTSGALTNGMRDAGGLLVGELKKGFSGEIGTAGKLFASQFISNAKASFLGAGANLGISVGQQVGASVVSALGSALAGRALGKGDVLGGLGGILASSLTAAAVGGPLVGAAVGGIGLVTAAFTASGESAKKAKAQIGEYKDAILEAGRASGEAAKATFISNLEKESQGTIDILDKVGFSIDALTAAADGNVGPLETIKARLKAIADEANLGTRVGDDRTFKAAKDALDFLGDELGEYQKGTLAAATTTRILERTIGDLGGPFNGVTRDLNAQSRRWQALADEVGGVDRGLEAAAGRYQGLADQFAKKQAAEALKEAERQAGEVRDRLGEANDEMYRLLNPDIGSFDSALNDLKLRLQGIGSDLQVGLGDVNAGKIQIGQAEVDSAVQSLQTAIGQAVDEGIADGLNTDQIKDRLAGLQLAIPELDVDQATKDALALTIQAALNSDAIDVKVQANTLAATEEGQKLLAAIEGELTKEKLDAAGQALMEGLARGIDTSAYLASEAARRAAASVETTVRDSFGIKSPSKVTREIGTFVTQGLALGISDGQSGAVAATRQMGSAVGAAVGDSISAAITASGSTIAQATSDVLRESLQAAADASDFAKSIRDAISGAVDDAFSGPAGIFDAESGLFSSFSSLAQRAVDAKGNRSLALNDKEGLSNVGAVEAAVKAITSLAGELAQQGSPTGEIAARLADEREKLLAFGQYLGFSNDALASLVDQLGLSGENISKFAKTAADAETLTRLNAAETGGIVGGRSLQQINNIQLATPYGDPEAVALATANRLALQARI